jgi:tetratricopeptide (TPR) repeat protein
MNSKVILLVVVILSLLMPAQEKMTIVQFDQHYELLSTGNMNAIWDLTIIPGEGVKSMLLHAFFSPKAYIKDVVVTDSEGSLNSKMITKEGVPILEITFRGRLTPGAEYHFTCNLDVWKAVDIGETEGTFTLLTGYNFPVENLNITTVLSEGMKLRNYFPADGRASNNTVSWVMNTLPSGYNIQISIYFDVLSESFADNVFEDGVNLYDLQDLDNARKKFEQARSIYESLDVQAKVDACTMYLEQIEGLEEGLPLMTEAVNLYAQKEYDQALSKFEQVKSIYEDHHISTDEIDEYISTITVYQEAFSELQKGEAALNTGKGEEAKTHFLRAKELFSEVGDSDMVEEIDAKLAQISVPEEVIEPQEPSSISTVTIMLVVIVSIVLASILLMKYKSREPPIYTEEEIREEMRQLKARFVYGEINKKDYEERLAELEEKLNKPE